MLTRESAAHIATFARECEIAYAFDHTGEITYAVRASIRNPDCKVEIHGAAFAVPGEKVYNEATVAQGITNLWMQLGQSGNIGLSKQTDGQAVTLTGEPLQDLIQLGAAIHGIPTNT